MDRAAQECWENSAERAAILRGCNELNEKLTGVFDSMTGEIKALTESNDELTIDNAILEKKVVRNRRIAIGTTSGAIALGVIFITLK